MEIFNIGYTSPCNKNNKNTIRYHPDALRCIGDDINHDRRYKILPFGCIETIRNLKLNAKPSARRKTQHCRIQQYGVKRANLITIKKSQHHDPNVIIATVNAQSVRTKELQLSELSKDHALDILVVTETWLNNKDKIWCNSTSLNNLQNLHFRHRTKGKGGGLMLICKPSIKVTTLQKGET